MGASICEIPIKNVNRERGKSHYGIGRTFRVFFDLLTIRFLLKYMSRPLHFFGSFGSLSILFGGAISLFLAALKVFTHQHVMDNHGPLFVDCGCADPGWYADAGDLGCLASCRCGTITHAITNSGP